MRLVPILLGILLVAAGLLWAAQGSGIFPYPASSFMIGRPPWVGWGLLTAAAGALVLWAAGWGTRC